MEMLLEVSPLQEYEATSVAYVTHPQVAECRHRAEHQIHRQWENG